MPVKTHLAFLRAVNVGGTGKLEMAGLRAWLTKLGFVDVQTVLQTGNVVFRGGKLTGATLERFLEAEAAAHFGVNLVFIVRAAEQWHEAIARNPFRSEARQDPAHVVLVVLKTAPTAARAKALQAAIKGPELVCVVGRHAYIVYPAGLGTSKLTLSVIERHLDTRGTARNWNTVLKIAAAANAL